MTWHPESVRAVTQISPRRELYNIKEEAREPGFFYDHHGS